MNGMRIPPPRPSTPPPSISTLQQTTSKDKVYSKSSGPPSPPVAKVQSLVEKYMGRVAQFFKRSMESEASTLKRELNDFFDGGKTRLFGFAKEKEIPPGPVNNHPKFQKMMGEIGDKFLEQEKALKLELSKDRSALHPYKDHVFSWFDVHRRGFFLTPALKIREALNRGDEAGAKEIMDKFQSDLKNKGSIETFVSQQNRRITGYQPL